MSSSNTQFDLISALAITCITLNIILIICIVYQCAYFVQNAKFQQHQAFKIRGKSIFLLTAVVMILNIIFRPMLVSVSLMHLVTIDSSFWRGVMDIVQMSLYAIIEFRCWITYFNLNSSTAIVDQQWKKYLDDHAISETNDCFRYCQSVLGRPFYVGAFFAFHGILCVIVCGLVEEYQTFDPHRIICHFFMANVLIFILFLHRMHITYTRVNHTYSHDMLAINRELNLTTMIMTITAISDSALGFYLQTASMAHVPYMVYQTTVIALLAIIIFYLPQRIITHLLELENTVKLQGGTHGVELGHIFGDTDLYHTFIRFTIHEWSPENLLFVTHWMQIQKIIVDAGISVKVNRNYSCKCEYTGTDKCHLLHLPSDVLLYSHNILEATRGIYDKFVKTNDILQINIGHQAREELNAFYAKHRDISPIFAVYNNTSTELGDRATVVVVDGADNNEMTVKYQLFMRQLQSGAVDIEVIQQMVDAYSGAVKNCWENACDSFSRFQSTVNYKINSSYFNLQKDAKTIA